MKRVKDFLKVRGVFSTGARGALPPAILKNRLFTSAIFGHFGTVGKNCGCYLNKNLIKSQQPQYQVILNTPL